MTQKYTLRAMANNYKNGHSWDHLDGEVAMLAANEIERLETELQEARDVIKMLNLFRYRSY